MALADSVAPVLPRLPRKPLPACTTAPWEWVALSVVPVWVALCGSLPSGKLWCGEQRITAGAGQVDHDLLWSAGLRGVLRQLIAIRGAKWGVCGRDLPGRP